MPRPGPAALLLLAALGSGCSGSGGGGAPGAPAPALASAELDARDDLGPWTLRVTVTDEEQRDLRITVEYRDSAAGDAGWRRATVAGAADPVAAATTPTVHELSWDVAADLGFRTASAELRVSAAATTGSQVARRTVTVPDLGGAARRRRAIHAVRDPLLHYGLVNAATIALCQRHDVVVLHPSNANLDRATVAAIQQGVDPLDPADDVLVLGYVSVGEDLRTLAVDDATLATDPRFRGDGSGPRIDPRGPDADGGALDGLDPLGLPSPGGTGYASYYLDDNSVDRDPQNRGDGIPDRNVIFGGCFVNAGAPEWFDVIDAMTLDGVDRAAGLREVLTTDFGRGLGCDGLFLDTLDTCAPNYYTDSNSDNQSEFEWTAGGFTAFLARLRSTYPDAVLLQNRGLFYFDPRQPHYDVSPRALVDYVKFESFRLDSSTAHEFHPYFYPDNRYNIAPKLCAEAQRPDGFTVLSLGYAEGPAASMSHAALSDDTALGFGSLLEDLRLCEDQFGFRHYLTDAGLVIDNDFSMRHRTRVDTEPPSWSSTWNGNQYPWPTPPDPPTPRVGIQRADGGDGYIDVHWDVALDRSQVEYACYLSEGAPFDFGGDPMLQSARRVVLTPNLGAGYGDAHGAGQVAFQDRIGGVTNGVTYHLCIRARDEFGNEESNGMVLTAEPYRPPPFAIDGSFDDWRGRPVAVTDPADAADSGGPDWLTIQLGQDQDFVYVRATSENVFNLDGSPSSGYSRTLVMIDADDDASSGYAYSNLGSELLVSGDALFAQDALHWNAGFLQTLQIAPVTDITEWEFAIPRDALDTAAGGSATRVRLVFLNDETYDQAPDSGSVSLDLDPR